MQFYYDTKYEQLTPIARREDDIDASVHDSYIYIYIYIYILYI